MSNENENKNLDGIKKVNKDEIKKSRKIVLDLIAEEERALTAEAEKNKARPKPKILTPKMDGISGKPPGKGRKETDKKFENTPRIDLVHPSDESDEKKVEKLKNEVPETAPAVKPISVAPQPAPKPERHPTRIEKAQLESIVRIDPDIRAPKVKPKTEEKYALGAKEKPAPIKLRKAPRIELRAKLPSADNEPSPVKKKQAKKSKKAGSLLSGALGSIVNPVKQKKETLKNSIKYSFIYLSFLLLVFLLMYSFFAVSLLRFNIDFKLARKVAEYLPVPAVITKDGVVDYYTYRDIRTAIESEEETKIGLIKTLIKSSLIARYGIEEKEEDKIIEAINYRIVFDHDINQVGIKRIRKIKEMIDEDGEFVKIANKYGDDQGQITIDLNDEDEYDFRDKISALGINDTSGIIYQPDGYYIFRCYEKDSSSLGLSYVFIRAKNLDEHIDETISDYRIWSFVN